MTGGSRYGSPDGTPTQTVRLHCVRTPRLGRRSRRLGAIGAQFGIPLHGRPMTVLQAVDLELSPGRIVLLLGPSGSGKTAALDQIGRSAEGGCAVNRIRFPADAAVVDSIAATAPLGQALSLLSACALGEAHLWVRRFGELSDGEKFRARLARALGFHVCRRLSGPMICDEFCTNLHRRAAMAISFNLRKLVDRARLSVVLAAGHGDVVHDLQPDVVVRLHGRGRCEVQRRVRRVRRWVSFRRHLSIEPGSLPDYNAFAAMHYRAGDQLALIDKVFLLRDRRTGENLGVVTYGYCALELSMRAKATGGRFSQDPGKLNRSFRILRRLVIHPDLRGCGLGHWLVERTLPLVGTNYVECLAAMGAVNPVFERAGMRRIGQYDVAPRCKAALAKLRAMDVDPAAREFPMLVARRPRVRRIVSDIVFHWYRATTTNPIERLDRQSPETLAQTFRGVIGARPVYYLWSRRSAARSASRKRHRPTASHRRAKRPPSTEAANAGCGARTPRK